MNLWEYAQAQQLIPAEKEPVKEGKSKRLKVTLQNNEPTGWEQDIIKLHNSGYVYALLSQISLLQDFYNADNSGAYWERLIARANEITGALGNTEAGAYARELTMLTIDMLEQKTK